jgi:hypothetical protein
MSLDRPLTFCACLVITSLAWLSALVPDASAARLASAAVITALCAGIVFLRFPSKQRLRAIFLPSVARRPRSEGAQFEHELFVLCAALRLGIDFCERHLNGGVEPLIERLEEMGENIRGFVNRMTRPVRFYRPSDRAAGLSPLPSEAARSGGESVPCPHRFR